jgi:RHS repeat-associated protein
LSNEETTPVEVYFDDFKVTQVKTPVVSTSEYYPFGLAFNEFRREGMTILPISFNGKEMQDELGLGWLDYGKRMLNPKTGRWMVPDQMAEVSPNLTPFRYAYNNPVRYVDPNGMYETDGHFWTVYLVATILNLSNAGSIAQWTEAPDNWMDQNGDSHFGTKTYMTPSWRGPVHSLTGGTPDYEQWLSMTGVLQASNDVSLGISLHRLGDSFAHTIPGKEGMFGPDVGHLFYGHSPDKIKNRPELYLKYVDVLFETLSLKYGKSGGNWDRFTFDFIASAGMGTAENSAILETEIAIRTGKKSFSVEGDQKSVISNYMKYRQSVTGTSMGVNVVHTTSDVYEYNASSGEFVKTGTRSISVVTFEND